MADIPVFSRAAQLRSTFLSAATPASEPEGASTAPRLRLLDGAMATQLFARGVLPTRCLEELNLSLAALVRDVHRDYLAAGAEVLTTNTFGANRVRLAAFGLEKKVAQVNQAAVRIARQAAAKHQPDSERQAFVIGSIGPLGVRMAPLGGMSEAEAKAAFAEQAAALLKAGVDGVTLETFGTLDELRIAVSAVREASPDAVIFAQLAVTDYGLLPDGTPLQEVAGALGAFPADFVGVNCTGPWAAVNAIRNVAAATEKPLIARPNAGIPEPGPSGLQFPCSPQYLASIAQQLIDAGATVIGGCCGTTPEHIKAMGTVLASAVAPVRPGRSEIAESVAEESVASAAATAATSPVGMPVAMPVVMEEKSLLGAKLARGEFVTILELPGIEIAELAEALGVDAAGGSLIPDLKSPAAAGIDAIGIASAFHATHQVSAAATGQILQRQAGIEALLYVPCRNRTVSALETELLAAQALGLRNVLCLTGRAPGSAEVDAIGLVEIARRLNTGRDSAGHALSRDGQVRTSLLVGVAANASAADPDQEIERLKSKVRGGAEFAMTLPIFDLDQFRTFVVRIRAEFGSLPVIAAVEALQDAAHAEAVRNEDGVTIPQSLIDRLQAATDPQAEGIAIARELARDLRGIANGIRVVARRGGLQTALDLVTPGA